MRNHLQLTSKFFAIFIALFFGILLGSIEVVAQTTTITIGSGTSASSYLPTYAYYKYSFTEQIYTAAEIGGRGTISAVAFKVSNSKSATRTVDLYMKHTSKTAFSSTSGWESLSSTDMVFSGSVTFNSSGWTTITLDTPFLYDGINNLVIGLDDNTGSSVSSSSNSPQFYVYSTSANRALRIYNSSTNYNPASMAYSGSYVTSNDQIMLTMSLSTGAVAGAFTVNYSGDKVFFSRGNLQYKASTGKWRFAENQYEYAGVHNTSISSTYSNWIDLFGWGTSGWNNGNRYYQPWNSTTGGNAYGPPDFFNLTGTYANADWGVYNAISNGGNTAGIWRTLTLEEWNYLFTYRSTTTGIRYAKAYVNGTNGVILLPDNWSASYYSLNNTNEASADFSSNYISASEWRNMEQYGAVFLPAAGVRDGTSLTSVGSYGAYWSSSYGLDLDYAYCRYFNDNSIEDLSTFDRSRGCSVRLVRPVQSGYVGIKAFSSPMDCGVASGGGLYQTGAQCTLTATANSGYAFINWKKGNTVVSSNPTYTFTVTGEESYTATFLPAYSISVSANPSSYGTVTGGGYYPQGTQVTLTATANSGYAFDNWTKDGVVVSTSPSLSFAVTEEGSYVANFLPAYTITVSASPTAGGTVIGGGTYKEGETCTLTASHAENYYFLNWKESGTQVSTEAAYSFTVTKNRTIVAYFSYLDGSPTGAIDGFFSVSDSKSVWFSQGNLQYLSSSKTWRFAENQWDFAGGCQYTNYNAGQYECVGNVTGCTDLFAWGTSGFSHGASYYQPPGISIDDDCEGYFAYGSSSYNLYDQTGKADWGYNAISNGGNQTYLWRTLTSAEWNYLFNTRTPASGIRYAKATVNEVKGVILLPDDWNPSIASLNNPNEANVGFSVNNIDATQWVSFASNGAVFLPVTGIKVMYKYESKLNITEVLGLGVGYLNEWDGAYWSSSAVDDCSAGCLLFGQKGYTNTYYLSVNNDGERSYGRAVRLVRDTPYQYGQIRTSASPNNGGTVQGGGVYEIGTTCTLTAIPASGYYFVNWTKNGTVVSTNPNYSFLVTGTVDLVANFVDIDGNLTGVFSVANGVQVNFSQGNLQYQASSNIWRFAENQWDYVGNDNSNISSANGGWIDLFGWGTSGWNSGANCYQPWSTSTSYSDYYPGGSETNNLTGDYANADWGVYNAISNGSDRTGIWRSLTRSEWEYVLNTRSTPSGIRYAKAQVNGVNGLILLPDNWSAGNYTLYGTNSTNAGYSTNIINATQWENNLEAYGAVFLPAAGYRNGTSISSVGSYGRYWSSTYRNYSYADNVYFYSSSVSSSYGYRYYGYSVRLVCPPSDDYLGINATCYPTSGGVVSGGGTYLSGASCTLTVTINSGYSFTGWFKNGTLVSSKPIYTFTVTDAADYEARFVQGAVAGNLTGAFSIANGIQVNFSQGNLLYQASTNTWRFADHQYDYVGSSNNNISSTNTGWIDLFGWGTSGWNSGVSAYQPWSTNISSNDYLPNSLTGTYSNADWGVYNAISNGGNHSGLWRALTNSEWQYILNTRVTASGIRYAKAKVNGVNGLILLPDDWNSANYALTNINIKKANFNSNVISASIWASKFEAYGAVFLPAAGYRYNTTISSVGSHGIYWSSSMYSSTPGYTWSANVLGFHDTDFGSVYGTNGQDMEFGCSVRLACPTQNAYYNIYTNSSPSIGGVVSDGRAYQAGSECTVTATANTGWAFVSWTDNGEVVSTDASYTFTVTDNRTLKAIFKNNFNIIVSANPSEGGTVSLNKEVTNTYDFENGAFPAEWDNSCSSYPWVIWSTNPHSGTYCLASSNYNKNSTESYFEATVEFVEDGSVAFYSRISSESASYDYGRFYIDGTQKLNEGGTSPNSWTSRSYAVTAGTHVFRWYYRKDSSQHSGDDRYFIDDITFTGARLEPAFLYGETCELTAVANEGYAFVSWTENGEMVSPDANYNFTVTGDRTLEANFAPSCTITVSPNPTMGGTVTGAGTYPLGSSCTLTANASAGYTFVNWTKNGAQVSTSATYTFTVTGTAALVANFTLNSCAITATANPTAGGTITGAGTYNYGSSCTLTATPATGYNFTKWTKNGAQVSTSATYTFTVTEAASYVAVFTKKTYAIAATANPTAGGTITGTGTYNHGSSCTLTATPATGYSFVNWTQNGTQVSTNASYQFTVTGAKTLVANFSPNTYTVTLNTNNGTINSGNVTSYTYGVGATLPTNVTRTGYTFGGWYDNANLTGTAVTAISTTATGNKTFWAKWTVNSYDITVTANPTAGGSVTGAGTYNHFDNCMLTATTNTGYTFQNWTLDGNAVSSNAEYTFQVSGAGNYVANFSLNSYAITAIADPTAGGIVTGAGTYNHGETVMLTATPMEGYSFVNWTRNGTEVSTAITYSFTVTEAGDYAAHFSLNSYAIAATANPSAGGTITGAGTYNHGESCTLKASAADGYTFENWTENGVEVSREMEYTFTVEGARTLVANFTLDTYAITAEANPVEGGTIAGEGFVDGEGEFPYGSTCTVTATANEGYTFVNWTKFGVEVAATATYTFTVEAPAVLVANFTLNSYSITATANPSAGGTITGAGTYNHGESCTLKASAADGYTFENWTENGVEVSREMEYTFTVEGARTLVANFTLDTYAITAEASPVEGGTVAGEGFVDGEGDFSYGSTCTVTASANEGYTFVNWTKFGVEVATTPTFTFTVEAPAVLVANFTLNSYDITAIADPTAGGTVTGAGTYNHGETVTLTVTVNEGYVFDGWTKAGEEVSTELSISFTATEAADYVAHFTLLSYPVEITAFPAEGGTVTGAGTYYHGDQCTLTATPNANYLFVNWLKDGAVVSTSPSYSFEVTGPATYVASFIRFFFNVSVDVNPTEGGTVTGTGSFYYGETVTLTASPADGYEFVNWTENGEEVSTSESYSFAVTGDRSLTANFWVPVETQTVTLNQGWNWWSTYIEMNGINGLQLLEDALGDNATQIKSQNGFLLYENNAWDGNLTALANEQMYRIDAVQAGNFAINGLVADPAEHTVTLRQGWNWIGYVENTVMEHNAALANLTTASENDCLKSYTNFATYYEGYGWYGGLEIMEPGLGYMLLTANAGSFTYASSDKGTVVNISQSNVNSYWRPVTGKFPDNMNVLAVIEYNGNELRTEDAELAAFDMNGECRGTALLSYVAPIDRYIAFLTVYGEEGDALHFLVRHEDATYQVNEQLTMVVDEVVGKGTEPFKMTVNGAGIDEIIVGLNLYPNPVEKGQEVRIELPETLGNATIEVIDVMGRSIYSNTVNGRDEMHIVSTPNARGVYTIRVIGEQGKTWHGKLIVK